MANTINIAGLQRASEKYQGDLRTLPFVVLIEVLKELSFNMLEVDNRDIVIVKERNGGIARPYSPGGNINYKGELSRMVERKLETQFANAAIKDNILNYKDKKVVLDSRDKINNKTKKHPYEFEILKDMIITLAEDIIDALFFAKRDTADLSPLGMCDGIYTIIADLITAGEISLAKGNLRQIASLAAPGDGVTTNAYVSLRDWLRGVDPKMRRNALGLYIPTGTLLNVKDALEDRKSGYKDINFEAVLAHLREDCQLPKLSLKSHYTLGTGNKLMLTLPGNLDLGMNTFSDVSFVQPRTPWEDPNMVQYWMQFEIGMRVTNTHKRALMVSDGTATGLEMSGDYQGSTGDETVSV